MRPEQYHARDLVRLFKKKWIATIAELKEALGTKADATVFRKLKTLPYFTSYSHSGSYYTLDGIAHFDDYGLWSFRSVHFSKYGTLLDTAEALVWEAEAGWHANELEAFLQVSAKESLFKLIRKGRVSRKKIGRRFLYCSTDLKIRKKQLRSRGILEIEAALGSLPVGSRINPDEQKAAIVLFFGLLDEKQRRLYAGLESLKYGHGGDHKVAELLGLDVGTIARGRKQLLEHDVEVSRVRKKGGGRLPMKKKRPK